MPSWSLKVIEAQTELIIFPPPTKSPLAVLGLAVLPSIQVQNPGTTFNTPPPPPKHPTGLFTFPASLAPDPLRLCCYYLAQGLTFRLDYVNIFPQLTS